VPAVCYRHRHFGEDGVLVTCAACKEVTAESVDTDHSHKPYYASHILQPSYRIISRQMLSIAVVWDDPCWPHHRVISTDRTWRDSLLYFAYVNRVTWL